MKELRGKTRFVGLQVSHEMPLEIGSARKRADFGLCLLDPVFAEMDETGADHFCDHCHREGLGHREKRDFALGPAAERGCAGYALANSLDVACDVFHRLSAD